MLEAIHPPLPLDLPQIAHEAETSARPANCAISAAKTASRFDYTVLPADLSKAMRLAAARVQQLHRAAVIEVGRELIAIKDRLEHGQFLKWVTRECQMSVRGAQRAMQAAEMITKNDKLSYLPPDGLLAIASCTAPEDALAVVLQRIEKGERPSAVEIKRYLKNASECEQTAAPQALLTAMPPLTRRQQRYRAWLDAEYQRRLEENRREQAECEDAASAAVELLVDGLGNRLQDFIDLLAKTDPYIFAQSLRTRKAAEAKDCPPPKPEHPLRPDDQGSMEDDGGLLRIWEQLKPDAQKCGYKWMIEGCPNTPPDDEHHVITKVLMPFRRAWDSASKEVRGRFLDQIGIVREGGSGGSEPKEATEDESGRGHVVDEEHKLHELAPESEADSPEEPLLPIWLGLKPNTKLRGREWVQLGCPEAPRADEAITITESLRAFRAAARASTPQQRARFLEITRQSAV
jgi:hypothetical protein